MAEWDRREMGRECTQRITRSRDRPERRPPSTPPPRIRRLLQCRPSPHRAAGFPDGPTHRASTVARGPSCWIASSRWPSSSLRVAGSSLICLIVTAERLLWLRRINKENTLSQRVEGRQDGAKIVHNFEPTLRHCLGELREERETPDPDARGRMDRIGQGRRHGGHAHLSRTLGLAPALDDLDLDVWCRCHL